MFNIDGKTASFYAIILGFVTAVMTVISGGLHIICQTVRLKYIILENLGNIEYFFDVLIPVLLIGILLLLFKNQGERTFSSKWWIPVAVIFYTMSIVSVSHFLEKLIWLFISSETFDGIGILKEFLFIFGFSVLTIGIFSRKNQNLFPVGFCAICLAYIIRFFVSFLNEAMLLSNLTEVIENLPDIVDIKRFLPVVAFALLLVLSAGVEKKMVRTLAVIFVFLSILWGQIDFFEGFAYLVFAVLMVPVTKDEFRVRFIAAILFFAMFLLTTEGFGYISSLPQLLVLFVFLAAPLLLSICFFAGKYEKVAAVGLILMFICLIISTFYDAGIYAFNYLYRTITPLVVLKTVSLILFGFILFHPENSKNKVFKVFLILLSIVNFVLIFTVIDRIYDSEYIIENMLIGWNLMFDCAILVSAFILVPFRYTKYQGIGKHIVLSIVTLGIWQLIWIYQMSKCLELPDKDTKYKYCKELLLCFIPFYYLYWNYKAAFATDKYAENNGVESKQGIMTFLLCLISPLITSILIQNKINAVENKKQG